MSEQFQDPKQIPAFSDEELERQALKTELDQEATQIESTVGNEEVPPEPHVPPEIIQEIIQNTYPSAQ